MNIFLREVDLSVKGFQLTNDVLRSYGDLLSLHLRLRRLLTHSLAEGLKCLNLMMNTLQNFGELIIIGDHVALVKVLKLLYRRCIDQKHFLLHLFAKVIVIFIASLGLNCGVKISSFTLGLCHFLLVGFLHLGNLKSDIRSLMLFSGLQKLL